MFLRGVRKRIVINQRGLTQTADTAVIKMKDLSRNPTLSMFQEELYLKSEMFLLITVFYWLTGLKKLAARASARRYFSDQDEKK